MAKAKKPAVKQTKKKAVAIKTKARPKNKARPSTKSRAQAKAASKEALIKAAMDLVPDHGLDISLDAICEHAGYTRGAFYVHFKNRDELMQEVMTQVGDDFLSWIFENHDEQEPLKLEQLAIKLINAIATGEYPIAKNGWIRPHQLLEACLRSEKLYKTYEGLALESIDKLATVITTSQDNRTIREDIPAQELSQLLVSLVVGMHTLYDLDFPIDYSKTLPTLIKVLLPNN
ncbi:MAG: TetR/AcrR family transcriptional regulator [Pseudomonadales bacterium]|nr:TetR/AcrR family transcriptional regulator [Pseudomonadales bacterium]